MKPLERYQKSLDEDGFTHDAAQLSAVQRLQLLYEQLLDYNPKRHFLSKIFQRQKTPIGLYLLGGTGRGKTYLVDCFYACIPFKEKHRTHFHQFMRDIHEKLRALPRTPNPLNIIARDLASRIRLLCLDEFHIHDIGDAMIMAGLIEAMHNYNIVLIATSNIAIDHLYQNGLQRERFLPTIDLLHQVTDEIDLGDGTDYRKQIIASETSYRICPNGSCNNYLEDYLAKIAPCPAKHNRDIIVNSRPLYYIAMADSVIWFDFDTLCNGPRSDSDYIYIAEIFQTVFISNIYCMHDEHDNIAKRFIHLIDALYDHKVKCIITAESDPQNLYQGRVLQHAFQRTISRLSEMSGSAYLAAAHIIDTSKSD